MLDKLPSFDRDQPIVRVWRNRDFALFMGGIGPYYITSWMQRVSVGWLAWEMTHSTAWLGAVAAADMAPMLLLGAVGGAVADRWDPVKLMKLTLALHGLQACLLSGLTLAGLMTIEILFCLALMTGLNMPFYSAARLTCIPAAVPRIDYPSATALDSSFFHGSRFIGPAIAAFTIPAFGIGATMVWHILGVSIFILMVSLMRVKPEPRASKHGGLMSEVMDGARYIVKHPGLYPMFVLMTIASIALRPVQDMLPAFAGAVFQSDAVGLSLLVSGMGVGAFISATMVAFMGKTRGLTNLVLWNCIGLAVGCLGFVATNWIAFGVVCAALVGFTIVYMSTATQALCQVAVTDDMRGRVMGFYSVVHRGTPALGAVLIGALAEVVGLRVTFAVASVIVLVSIVVFWARKSAIAEALEGRRG